MANKQSLSENQPRRGHLRGVSKNQVKRTGRSDGTGRVQKNLGGVSVEGYPDENSPNSTVPAGRASGFQRVYVAVKDRTAELKITRAKDNIRHGVK